MTIGTREVRRICRPPDGGHPEVVVPFDHEDGTAERVTVSWDGDPTALRLDSFRFRYHALATCPVTHLVRLEDETADITGLELAASAAGGLGIWSHRADPVHGATRSFAQLDAVARPTAIEPLPYADETWTTEQPLPSGIATDGRWLVCPFRSGDDLQCLGGTSGVDNATRRVFPTVGRIGPLALTASADGWWVTWIKRSDGDRERVYLERYAADLSHPPVEMHPVSWVNDVNASDPAVALRWDGTAAVVWLEAPTAGCPTRIRGALRGTVATGPSYLYDLAEVFDGEGRCIRPPLRLRARPGGEFSLVWVEEEVATAQAQVYRMRVDDAFEPHPNPDPRVVAQTTPLVAPPATAASANAVLVAWTTTRLGADGTAHYAYPVLRVDPLDSRPAAGPGVILEGPPVAEHGEPPQVGVALFDSGFFAVTHVGTSGSLATRLFGVACGYESEREAGVDAEGHTIREICIGNSWRRFTGD